MRLLERVGPCEFRLTRDLINNNHPYAILSHTWGEDDAEVTLEDLLQGTGKDKKGYEKIQLCGEQAARDGLRHFWVDTCCIDKTSSAELAEAINSMYRWYQRSTVCYVFLSDLPASASLPAALSRCRWFTRGWTLQELIAPKEVIFFDQEWKPRGSKRDLVELLSNTTGIGPGILRCEQELASIAVAQKMSWAAHRETTRIEDIAYCLLGIFDVNMPLLYGEEEKAFRRLQEEIIKSTADLSLFAWTIPSRLRSSEAHETRHYCGVLAEKPLYFAECGSLMRAPYVIGREFSVSNTGVRTRVQILIERISGTRGFRYVLPLDCFRNQQQSLGVRLRKCAPDTFIRDDPWTLVELIEGLFANALKDRYLLTRLPGSNFKRDLQLETDLLIAQLRSHAFQIKLPPEMYMYDAWPWSRFDDEDQLFFVSRENLGWDWVAFRLNVRLPLCDGKTQREVEFDCMFFATGWSSQQAEQLQCTLVDYQAFMNALNETTSQLSAWNPDSFGVRKQLTHNNIPRVSTVLHKFPGNRRGVLVTFKLTLITNPSICHNPFWGVEFNFHVCNAVDFPIVHSEDWVM